MFDLSSIGVTGRSADAPVVPSPTGEGTADPSSFTSFVDALRALGSPADGAADAAVLADVDFDLALSATWLTSGPSARTSGDEVSADDASTARAEGGAEDVAGVPVLIVAPDQTPNRAPVLWPLGMQPDGREAETGQAEETAEPQAGGFSTMVGGSGESRRQPRRAHAEGLPPGASTGEASAVADATTAHPFAAADQPDADSAGHGSLPTLLDELASESEDGSATATLASSPERAPVEMPVVPAAAGLSANTSGGSHRFARGRDEAEGAPRPSVERLVSGPAAAMSLSPISPVTQTYGWRVALAQTDAAAPPTAEPLPSDTTSQIVQAIRLQWTRGVGEAHIRLDPAQFGDLTISVRVDDGQVTARVQSDTAVVRDWLQSHQGWLRQSLSDQGLTLGHLEIQESASETRDERDPGERGAAPEDKDERSHRRPRRSPTDGVFEVVA